MGRPSGLAECQLFTKSLVRSRGASLVYDGRRDYSFEQNLPLRGVLEALGYGTTRARERTFKPYQVRQVREIILRYRLAATIPSDASDDA